MSLEDAIKFHKKMKEDDNFNEKVKRLSVDELAVYAKTIGLDFTSDEMVQAIARYVINDINTQRRNQLIKEKEEVKSIALIILIILAVIGFFIGGIGLSVVFGFCILIVDHYW